MNDTPAQQPQGAPGGAGLAPRLTRSRGLTAGCRAIAEMGQDRRRQARGGRRPADDPARPRRRAPVVPPRPRPLIEPSQAVTGFAGGRGCHHDLAARRPSEAVCTPVSCTKLVEYSTAFAVPVNKSDTSENSRILQTVVVCEHSARYPDTYWRTLSLGPICYV
jgi:hypothetical protein